MTELLIQSATATSRSKQLAAEAARIKANCAAQHGDNKPLVSCSQCYEALVEAVRTRYLNPDSDSSQGDASTRRQQSQQPEWFTFRRTFLSELDLMLDSVKEYQSSPQAVDDRVREERSRWYAERVRSSLLRLMAEDPSQRGAVFEKLEDQSTLATGGDSVALAEEVAEILKTGPLAVEAGQERIRELPQKLAAATDAAGKVGVLKDILFKAEDGTVPEDHQKYLDMLLNQGLSMEQVVDRILEERQTAIGASQQIDKLKQRLDELRRARAAHEAHKTRKAQRRESLAQQKVPDELYDLPVCAVCGDAPSTKDFYCCSVCTMLTEAGVQPQKTVFCSDKCEQQGYEYRAKDIGALTTGFGDAVKEWEGKNRVKLQSTA
ncbi:hypothetical protein N0V88_003527 [Collariella sp. IMI 366227]|nr:hypothetical protein N0V88_003527 [Collariella sp. IMI 366227]